MATVKLGIDEIALNIPTPFQYNNGLFSFLSSSEKGFSVKTLDGCISVAPINILLVSSYGVNILEVWFYK